MTHDDFDLDGLDSLETTPTAPTKMAAGSAEPAYMVGLNEAQRDAVLALDGPVLVLAGAGTGKTRVLTTRLSHLMVTGKAAPWNMLAVTFTNKAAREMQDRVARLLGRPVEGLWIGTFHSVAAKILRKHAEVVGLKSNFTILDTDDQIRVIKQLIQAEGIDDKRWPARMMAGLIDRWKNRAATPERIPESESYAYAEGLGGKIYKAYQARLKVLNACDFGDLLLHNITLFQSKPDILAQYHDQFRYILVDEYQDTNVAQYLWLRLLAQAHHNICCVGDDDQSIYGWRGAEVGNILRFSEDFPGAKVVKLEQNYRSTGHILAAASGLITANEGRLGKTLWTDSGNGEKVSVRGVWDSREEARTISDEIESMQLKSYPLNEVAILVRAGFQTREFEERMINLGLPYRVVGGPRFYERAEIRDAMAYLRVIAQSDNDLAFERIVNQPKRGLGTSTVQKIHHLSRAHNISMVSAAMQITELDELRPAARRSLGGLMDNFARWRGLLATLPHTELAEMVLEESGIVKMWQDDTSPQAPGKLENLRELITGMAEFENLTGFLEHIELVMENEKKDDVAKLSIMTLHAAKGLEFNMVFLPGWEEGVFPNQRSLDEGGLKSLEEERRLAYVGITRARIKATIYFAGSRQIFGQWQSSLPSRFIDELPADHLDIDSEQGLQGNTARGGWHSSEGDDASSDDFGGYEAYDQNNSGSGYGPGWQRAQKFKAGGSRGDKINKQRGPKTIDGSARRVAKKPVVSNIAIGERVFHDKFGYGTVTDAEGNKLLVNFENSGEKRVLDSFVKST